MLTNFSPKVYGETLFDFAEKIIQFAKLTDDFLIDLGSVIGQLVLQISTSTPCKKAYGIEIADWPSKYAAVSINTWKNLI